MILVTTGTALADDTLIQNIDKMVGDKEISSDIVAQIGDGDYTPINFKAFRYITNIVSIFELADIIISSCGAGTIFEVLELRKPLIVIQNPKIIGGHEWELVKKLEDLNLLFWCKNYRELPSLIEKAKNHKFSKMSFKPFDYKEFNKLVGL